MQVKQEPINHTEQHRMMAEAVSQVMVDSGPTTRKNFQELSDLVGEDSAPLIQMMLSFMELLPRVKQHNGTAAIKLETYMNKIKSVLTVEGLFHQITANLDKKTAVKVMDKLGDYIQYRFRGDLSLTTKEAVWAACGAIPAKSMPDKVRDRYAGDVGGRKSWSTLTEEKVEAVIAANMTTIAKIIHQFNETAHVYEVTSIRNPGKSASTALIRIDYSQPRENQMFLEPLPKASHIIGMDLSDENTLHAKAFEVIRNKAYTLDANFNAVMVSFINDEAMFRKHVIKKVMTKRDADLTLKAYKYCIENALSDWDKIGRKKYYSKYVIDARGRISQLGDVTAVASKIARPMLRSGEGAALGQNGYNNLLMDLGSAMGLDKKTFEERLAHCQAEGMTEKYIGIGNQLLAGGTDGLKSLIDAGADDLFQAAADCMELARIAAYNKDGGRTEDYVSNVFLGIDGTCSAYQHMGCLTRSTSLMEATNIYSDENTEDKIHDIYSILTDALVEVAPGNEEIVEYMDIENKLKRKISKAMLMKKGYACSHQTLMTSVMEVVEGLWAGDEEETSWKKAWDFSKAMANIFKRLYSEHPTFKSAREYEKICHDIAEAYTSKGMQMSWTLDMNPTRHSGSPISPRYRTSDGKRIHTPLLGKDTIIRDFGVDIMSNDRSACISKTKMVLNANKVKTAALPNLIHSCDAFHLYSTVMNAQELMNDETSFALTHDCIGVVAGHMDALKDAVKESWLQMYGNHNILESIIDECNRVTGSELSITNYDINPKTDMTAVISAAKYSFS